MRTLDAALTAQQKRASVSPLIKIVLTQGATTETHEQDRILSIPEHYEAPYDQHATILLNNSDGLLTAKDYQGYKGVISWGMYVDSLAAADMYSACAPLYVIGQ